MDLLKRFLSTRPSGAECSKFNADAAAEALKERQEEAQEEARATSMVQQNPNQIDVMKFDINNVMSAQNQESF